MEEARDSISQTVNEIKETVTTQYENVKDTISQSLDWREQYRRRPIAFTAGALGVGLILGYSVGGVAFGGEDDLAERYYEAEGENDDTLQPEGRSYAAQAITGGAYGSTAYAPAPPAQSYDAGTESASSRPSYSSGYESASPSDEADKPSLISRFKETKAYDRLQDEVATLGERAVEELSKTARNVVLPALLGKLKDMIGIDLSTQREVAQRSKLEQQSAASSAQADPNATGTGSGTTYGTGSGGYGKTL
jgi:ElaB/YqjD/DUF883 family membrane-anchored ribosome-binding protein